MTRRLEKRALTGRPAAALPVILMLALALAAGACASGRAFSRGQRAAEAGDWDTAVAYYTRAVQAKPDHPEYKVALQRALQNAAVAHLERGRIFEAKAQTEEALREYRRASEFDPLSGEIQARVSEVERKLREKMEATRPKPRIEQLREQARQLSPEPMLNPASRAPLDVVFNNARVSEILKFVAQWTGINITFERDAVRAIENQNYTVELHGVTLEQALYQILTATGYFYKVLDPHTIMVIQESPTKRQAYEEQAIQTFFLSHSEAQDVQNILQTIVRMPGMINPPTIQFNKNANTITIRAAAPVLKVFEQVIQANDKPRAELILDIEILEINRTRAAQYGLDLNSYSINAVFSPDAPPGTDAGTSFFNLNALKDITRGDFYLSVPAAVIRILETDTDTKLVAKPQLRGSEGEKLTLNLGSQIPVPTTTFGSFAGGGVNTIPISSFTLKDVGLNFAITPRVTFENDIILTIDLENSTFAGSINIAGQNLPSFGSRKVSTRLRLRDGEPNLLAGLLQTDQSKAVTGFPGLLRLPVFKQLFSSNNNRTTQTDIVMLLTPHVIRSHQLTAQDVNPIFIGTSNSMGLTGPPPLIAAPPVAGEQPPAAGQAVPGSPTGTTPPGAAPGAKPGAPPPVTPPNLSPQPGTVSPPPVQPGAAAPTAAGGGVVAVTVTGPDFRVGGGPYTVPITISGASGVSAMSVTIRFNPAVLRVRGVQEGSFMRQGGVSANFAQQVDTATGRIDMTFTRAGDTTGASATGTELLAAILFDAIGAGSSALSVSGVANGPTGAAVQLQFAPATVTVR